MKKYQNLNNLIGWLVFLAASVVYLLTAEPTTSWWDCGEYIATAYKLEVGHPPGAPTFQLIGQIASLFTGGDVTKVAYTINAMSAISSSLTILFLFWSITLIAKKVVLRTSKEIDTFKMVCIFGSGVVGALAYTFSDTFWFSAVEGEVYAMSSLFTAMVFWVILKWESLADEKHSLRWLILLSLLVGVSIGVHLLNLLAIPAIVFIYYFKKYKKISKKGMLYAFIISILLITVILFIIVPYIVILAGGFDVFFVNSLGLPFNSGTIFFFLLLLGGIVFGLYWTNKKNKPVWNAVILSSLFLIIGYSTFFILVIRANSNTPLNENEPKDAVSLRAYLGREQYGETPLFSGPYYTARPVKWNYGYNKYIKKDGKYVVAAQYKSLEFEKGESTIFPRMHNSNGKEHHITFYKYWTDIKTDRTPTFGENLEFFFRYQVNFMYWRYFMWNFAGRQNDIQGNYFNSDGSRDYLHGNWMTGIKFWDEARLGPQDNLPVELSSNKAHNVYFCLPLVLGLIGLFYHVKKSKRDAFIVFLLFFMTGLAIIIYVNQKPLEPRERDYAYAGSFYAFAIWIGLGVMALADWLSRKIPKMISASVVSITCLLLVPGIMAKENWDDHDRSKKYAARDFSKNHLTTCDKNSIYFTHGDNDTFPLWYMQEVEGYRTDIRIVNYTLAGMNWYTEQLYNALYEAKPIAFTLPKEMYNISHDYVYLRDNRNLELKDVLEFMKSGNPETKVRENDGKEVYILPTNRFKITLNKPDLVAKGIITQQIADSIPNEITWEIKSERIERNELMFLDLLATNGFERSMYISDPRSFTNIYSPVAEMVVREGLNFKILPYKPQNPEGMQYPIDLDKTVKLFNDEKTQWGNLNAPSVYIDPISENSASVARQDYSILALNLIKAGRKDDAVKTLEKGLKFFPSSKLPLDRYSVYYAHAYHELGNDKKAEEILREIVDYYQDQIKYYKQFKGAKAKGVSSAIEESTAFLYYYLLANAKQMNMVNLQKDIESFLNGLI